MKLCLWNLFSQIWRHHIIQPVFFCFYFVYYDYFSSEALQVFILFISINQTKLYTWLQPNNRILSLKRRMVFTVLCKIVNVCMYTSRFDKLTRNLSHGLLTNWPPIVHAGKLIFIDLLRVSVQERLCLRQKYIDIIQHHIILHFLLLKCVLYTDTVMDIGQCFSVYVCMYEWLLRCVVTYLYIW